MEVTGSGQKNSIICPRSRLFGGSPEGRLHTNSGFSLIEILVVIGIIAILSSLGMASFNRARLNARDLKRIGDLRQIEVALHLYFEANGTYPATLDVLDDAVLGGPFIPILPTPPGIAETSYRYGVPAVSPRTRYHLGADLELATHQALSNDADFDSAAGAWVNGFNGSQPPVYDIRS